MSKFKVGKRKISDSVFKNWRSDSDAKNEISPKVFEQWEINDEPILPME